MNVSTVEAVGESSSISDIGKRGIVDSELSSSSCIVCAGFRRSVEMSSALPFLRIVNAFVVLERTLYGPWYVGESPCRAASMRTNT